MVALVKVDAASEARLVLAKEMTVPTVPEHLEVAEEELALQGAPAAAEVTALRVTSLQRHWPPHLESERFPEALPILRVEEPGVMETHRELNA